MLMCHTNSNINNVHNVLFEIIHIVKEHVFIRKHVSQVRPTVKFQMYFGVTLIPDNTILYFEKKIVLRSQLKQ